MTRISNKSTASRFAIGSATCCALLTAAALWSSCARAQTSAAESYPSRPIKVIVPYVAGGSGDVLARMLGEKVSRKLGQPVVVENRPGANTIVGMEVVGRAAPDGYVLLLTSAAMTINPSVAKLPFDTVKDFTPIINLVAASQVLVVNPSVPANSLTELIALAKAKPGTLSFGSGGTASPGHVSGELLKSMAGVDIVHVPYKGIPPAITDLLGGQIQMLFADGLAILPHIKQGSVRAIAVCGASRYPSAPEIPTMAEAGLPGYENTLWWGLLGPGRMPPAIVARLNAAFAEALKAPDVKQRLTEMSVSVIGDGPEHFAQRIASDLDKWSKATAITSLLK